MNEDTTTLNNDSSNQRHDSDNLDTKSPNFVENLKRFFVRKFQIGSDSTQSASKQIQTSPEVQRTETSTPPLMNQPAQKPVSNEMLNHQSTDPFERYRQIIDEHKDKLPENFTIRRFPSSSCPDTFQDEPIELQSSVAISITAESTSSPSLTPSPIQQYAPTVTNNLHPNDNDDAFLNSSTKSEPAQPTQETLNDSSSLSYSTNGFDPPEMPSSTFLGDLNHSNKRFYHVFRQGELDSLVKIYCPSLKVYETYHDHGNHCICAIKE